MLQMEQNQNGDSPGKGQAAPPPTSEQREFRPEGPQARTRARSGASREDFAPADAGAENEDSAELQETLTLSPLAFTPVPRLQQRRDGWAPAVQQAFIEALADTGSVEAACRFVDRSPASAYRLRRHPEGGEFARAWQAAVDLGIQQIEDSAMDRALNGVEVPVFAYGDRIATRRVHNDQLVMFMLRNRAPDRYCADGARGMSAIDNRRLKRLKEAWRQEWAEERRQKEPDIEQVRQDMLRKVNAMKNAERQRWTQREWRLYGAWQRERLARRRREKEEYQLSFIAHQNDHVRPGLEAAYRTAKERGDFDRDEPLTLPEILGDEELD